MNTTTEESLSTLGVAESRVAGLAAKIDSALAEVGPIAQWQRLSRQLLTPQIPFAVHAWLFERVFSDWHKSRGPAPAWTPLPEELAATNVARATRGDWASFHRFAREQPEAFWTAMFARLGVVFASPPDRVLDVGESVETARWLRGARMNVAQAVLAAAQSEPGRVAVITAGDDAPMRTVTIGELATSVQQIARGLHALGLRPGDAIAIDMPMTVASVASYLAIVHIGAAAVSIADSFAAAEISTRLRIARAKAIFTQDVIVRGDKRIPLYDRVCLADAPKAIVVAAEGTLSVTLRMGDISYDDLIAVGYDSDAVPVVIRDADAATNILFSSGTTGEPKAIVWTHVTPIKAATDGWAHQDIRAGDVVAWPTNLGWMMGPWLIYASLLNGAAMALYDGSPLTRGFTEWVTDARVTMLGVVPSLVRAWRSNGATEGVDWSTIRCFSSTGEASQAEDMLWLMSRAGYRPVIEYCGGTEIGGGYLCGSCLQPQAPSAFSTAAVGSAFVILDDDGEVAEEGELALVPPMLGSSDTLLNRDHHTVYFADMPPGPQAEVLRRHGDHVGHLGAGYYRALGRVDDTMNLGGIKTSSADIERVLAGITDVVESAAIAVAPSGGGPSRLVLYAVVAEGSGHTAESLRPIFQRHIKRDLNPLFKLSDVVIVEALPRTASNKVMRRVLRGRYLQR